MANEHVMTIEYALTRGEIARGFIRSVVNSPKFRTKILLYALGFGVLQLLVTGAFTRPLAPVDFIVFFGSIVGFLVVFPLILSLLGKTSKRSLTISPDGISTKIGSISGQIGWGNISLISEIADYILIARTGGNAFFIPNRAFMSPEEKAQFVAMAMDRIETGKS
jgi:hypothetical protein